MSEGGQVLVVDQMGEVAERGNYYVVIREGKVWLVNRNQDINPVVAKFTRPALLSMQVNQPHPTRKLISSFTQNIPYPHSRRLEQQQIEVHIEANTFGMDEEVKPLSQVEKEVENFLLNWYNIQKRPKVKVQIQNIQKFDIGDRIECFDEYLEMKAVITIEGITYHFEDERTTVTGFALVNHVRES